MTRLVNGSDKSGQRGKQGRRLETEQDGQLDAFLNPKMHKEFPLSEVLISKGESLIFLSLSLHRGGILTKHNDIA